MLRMAFYMSLRSICSLLTAQTALFDSISISTIPQNSGFSSMRAAIFGRRPMRNENGNMRIWKVLGVRY